MTDGELLVHLNHYQKLLHLTQWTITIAEADNVDSIHSDAGAIYFSAASLDATMVICSQEIWDNGTKHDKEKSIVHELLHLQFSLFEPEEGTAEYMIWHQTIELVARTIVDLSREAK